ncbi:MAG TPA: zinc finger CCHC domain-containing protein, partial [Fusibacter sp.]|nr:zinc finger CCHC domain-containing protein [Fusibacter sp.]
MHTSLKSRIDSHPDYPAIRGDPIRLLEEIKILIHSPVRGRSPWVTMLEAFRRLFEAKQMKHEYVEDYIKRFKELFYTLQTMLGKDVFIDFLQKTNEWKEANDAGKNDEVTQMEAESFERVGAYLLVHGADPSRFDGLLQKWQEAFSAKKDQYPRTISEATDIMVNWKCPVRSNTNNKDGHGSNKDKSHHSNKNNNKNNKGKNNGANENKDKTETNLAQKGGGGGICYVCGETGHMKPQCKHKDKPEAEHWITKYRKAEAEHTKKRLSSKMETLNRRSMTLIISSRFMETISVFISWRRRYKATSKDSA